MIRAIRNFFSRNYEAIKMGVLVGLLVSNIFLIIKQADTLNQVLSVNKIIQRQIKEDNKNRVESRKENEQRNNLIIEYLRCIALIPYGQRNPESVDRCLAGQKVDRQERSEDDPNAPEQVVLPPINGSSMISPVERTNEPTTSAPPPEDVSPPAQNQNFLQQVLSPIIKPVTGLLDRVL